jgi:hypothetical protein
MIKHKVENKLYVALLAEVCKILEIIHIAESPVDLVVVLNVILVVGGRGENGRKPNSLNAKVVAVINIAVIEVIETVDYASKVADAVTVIVREGANKNLIEGSEVIVSGVCERGKHGIATVIIGLFAGKQLASGEGEKRKRHCDSKYQAD